MFKGKCATTETKNVVAPCLQCDLEEHSSQTKNDMKKAEKCPERVFTTRVKNYRGARLFFSM